MQGICTQGVESFRRLTGDVGCIGRKLVDEFQSVGRGNGARKGGHDGRVEVCAHHVKVVDMPHKCGVRVAACAGQFHRRATRERDHFSAAVSITPTQAIVATSGERFIASARKDATGSVTGDRHLLGVRHENAGQLALDPAQIGIKGESGGGGLAAAAVIYARDRQGPKFAFQHLIYPMIDDRTAVRKDLHPHVGEFVWTHEHNYFGWQSLLGREPGSAGVSPYAAASRAVDASCSRSSSVALYLARAPRVDGGACSGSA